MNTKLTYTSHESHSGECATRISPSEYEIDYMSHESSEYEIEDLTVLCVLNIETHES